VERVRLDISFHLPGDADLVSDELLLLTEKAGALARAGCKGMSRDDYRREGSQWDCKLSHHRIVLMTGHPTAWSSESFIQLAAALAMIDVISDCRGLASWPVVVRAPEIVGVPRFVREYFEYLAVPTGLRFRKLQSVVFCNGASFGDMNERIDCGYLLREQVVLRHPPLEE